jgi:nucleotide-binding universal stress UspA family protein
MLIAVDGSAFTERLLNFVIGHPELLGAEPDVTLITSVPAVPPHAARLVGRDTLTEYYQEEAEKVLAPARDALARAGIPAKALPCKGAAAITIAEHASSGPYDMVVMGSHGHSALANLALGSVVTGVLAHCKTPVLIVR